MYILLFHTEVDEQTQSTARWWRHWWWWWMIMTTTITTMMLMLRAPEKHETVVRLAHRIALVTNVSKGKSSCRPIGISVHFKLLFYKHDFNSKNEISIGKLKRMDHFQFSHTVSTRWATLNMHSYNSLHFIKECVIDLLPSFVLSMYCSTTMGWTFSHYRDTK